MLQPRIQGKKLTILLYIFTPLLLLRRSGQSQWLLYKHCRPLFINLITLFLPRLSAAVPSKPLEIALPVRK